MISLRYAICRTFILFTILTAVSLCPGLSEARQGQLTISLTANDYHILPGEDDFHQVQMEDFGSLLIPGKPQLPARTFSIALPPEAQVISVTVQPEPAAPIAGEFHIAPAPPSLPLTAESDLVVLKKIQWEQAYHSCYNSDQLFPEQPVLEMGTGAVRRYHFLRVAFFPLAYQPLSRRLWFTPRVEVQIDYRLAEGILEQKGLLQDMAAERLADQILVNYNQAKSWYPRPEMSKSLYDYVIITPPSLAPAVAPLMNWKMAIGRTPHVVTTAWIDSAYAGDDLPQKIRTFLREKYPQGQWGIQDVLIVADTDSIPMRICHVDPPAHANPTPTDYYFAELSQPDSLSWDSDGDGFYGEYQQDEIDFAPEVTVGRIPYSDTTTVGNICRKLVDFERDTGSWKQSALLLGAMANYENEDGGGWPRTDGATLMEVMSDSLLTGWSATKMYEDVGIHPSIYPHDDALTRNNVATHWSTGQYAVVNWSAHGNNAGAYRKYWRTDDGDSIPEMWEMSSPVFFQMGDESQLDDDYPSIVFSASCCNAKPGGPNVARSLLANGSAGIVAATELAWYNCGWMAPDDGGIASIDYHFFRYLLAQGETVGQALYDAKVYYHDYLFEAYPGDDIWSPQQNMMSLNLYGDPSLILEGVDVAPPAAVTDLKAILCDATIVLRWSAVTEDLYGNEETVSHYVVYRDSVPEFDPMSEDSIGFSWHTEFIDSASGVDLVGVNHYYVVRTVDMLGHKSSPSGAAGEFDRQLVSE